MPAVRRAATRWSLRDRAKARRARLIIAGAALSLFTPLPYAAQKTDGSPGPLGPVAPGGDDTVATDFRAPLPTGRQRSNELVWVLESNRGSVAVIDPGTDSVVAVIDPRVRDTGDDIAASDGAVWVSYLSNWVHRIDPETRQVVARIETETYNGGIVAGNGNVWVGNGDDGRLTHIDPETNRIAGTVETEYMVYDVALTDAAVWAATTEGQIQRFAPNASRVAQIIETDGEPNALVGHGGTLWASDLIFGRVLRVGPGGVEPIDVGVTSTEGPGLAVGFGSVWVGTGDNNTVIRIDAASKQVQTTIQLEGWVEDVATGAGSVWVALPENDRVVRIDPATNEVTARIRVTGFPNAIAVGGS